MLNYYSYGSSENTVILLHGFCENNTCFNKQVFFLQSNYKVVTIDLPGFGKSEPVSGITMAQIAQMVKVVLKGLNINKCMMLGHSMGGYVTLEFAKQFPELLDGFGLIHSTSFADTVERKHKRKQVITFIQNNGKEAYTKNFIPGLFYNLEAQKAEIDLAITQANTSCAQGIIDATKAMAKRVKNCEVLIEAKVPVFFAIGKHDAILSETDLMLQAQMPAISKICYLENSAHMGQVEEPEKLNQAILDFCQFVWR